jgi:hypothetical protein
MNAQTHRLAGSCRIGPPACRRGPIISTPGRQVNDRAELGYVAAPDGALWIAEKVRTLGQFEPPVTCQGVARFDGTRLERFLESLCIRFIDVGPDGSAWLLADEPDTLAPPDPVHLYVITREPE